MERIMTGEISPLKQTFDPNEKSGMFTEPSEKAAPKKSERRPGVEKASPDQPKTTENPIPPFNGADPVAAARKAARAASAAKAREAKARKKAEGAAADVKAPEIQPAGNFPGIDDALADMSQPPPKPPAEHLLLKHSSTPPRAAFRARPREGAGIFLWMVSLPYGTAQEGESFVHPIAASLRNPLAEECPALVPKRYEIRLIFDASRKYSLLEVAADPAHSERGEDNRQSLLRLLVLAEKQWILGERMSGLWVATPSAYEFSIEWPAQPLPELVARTYSDSIIRGMDCPILQRFRKRKPR
jgi:hypothetical protein